MFIPYRVDVPYDRKPFANWLILGLMAAVFFQQIAVLYKYGAEVAFHQQEQQKEQQKKNTGDSGAPAAETQVHIKNPLEPWILHGWNPQGLVGHMWLHAGFLHLFGNMLFLWLFGNAVCAKVGNKWYPLMYLFFGFCAAATHLIFNGGPALGASGAINGVVGMFVVFFPENEISCVWILFFPYMRRVSVSSYWIILLWFVFDIWGALTGGGNVAYFAHVGGFLAGFVLAIFLLERKWITMEDYEKSLLQLVGLEKRKGLDEQFSDYGRGWEPWQQEIAETGVSAGSAGASGTAVIAPEPPPEVSPPVAAQVTGAAAPAFVKVLCSCGKKVKFPVKYAGRTGRCPACNRPITVPDAEGGIKSASSTGAEDDMIRFNCECGMKIKVPSRYSSKTGKCPRCQSIIKIP